MLTVLLLAVSQPLAAQQWMRIEPADRPITVAATGIVASADAQRFGPPPSRSWRTTITRLAREGTRVQAGEVLVQFDASATDDRVRELDAQLNAKRSELESLLESQQNEIEQSKVRLADAESQAEKARRKADTDADLYASLEYRKLLEERAIAETLLEYEQRRAVLAERVRIATRAELEADLLRLESELAGARAELEAFTVRAPRDGLVIVGTDREGRKLDVNDTVNPGLVVVELVDDTRLEVHAEVPEFAAKRLAVGQHAEVEIDAAAGGALGGELTAVASLVRRQSQYSQAMVRDVVVSLGEGQAEGLRPGMSVKLTLEIDRLDAVLAVPDESIRYRDGRPGVEVRGDGWRPVQVGPASAGMHIIEGGLAAGEEVAL